MLLLLRLTWRRTALAEQLGEEPTPVLSGGNVVDLDYSSCAHWDRPGDVVAVLDDAHVLSATELAAFGVVSIPDAPAKDAAEVTPDNVTTKSLDLKSMLDPAKNPRLDAKTERALGKGASPRSMADVPVVSWADVQPFVVKA